MCGIIGYTGLKPVSDILYNGLKCLEYRGYDSAGMATLDKGELDARHVVGGVDGLGKRLKQKPLSGIVGIAHTRWATHGAPSELNAHPHLDEAGTFALVHNGIVENYTEIKADLQKKGVKFTSETDTETLVQLIGWIYRNNGQDLLGSVRQALKQVRGSFAMGLICKDEPATLVAARRGSPLLLGLGEGEYFIASDGSAIVEHTNQVVYLNDDELVYINPEGYRITTLDEEAVERPVKKLEMSFEEIQLNGYDHFMQKEMFEQPDSLRAVLKGRVDSGRGEVQLRGLANLDGDYTGCKRILASACGTAFYAGLIGEYLFEALARVPTEVEYASEMRYRNPIIEKKGDLGVVISQSGETADTLAALSEMQDRGAKVVGIVNAVGSTIARDTDAGVYLNIGPEIGVASTKAFTGQVAVLTMMAIHLGRTKGVLAKEEAWALLDGLTQVPEKIEAALELDGQIKKLAKKLNKHDNWLYLGRGVSYPVALEGALKLKEISYIHAEGMPAAEMKHGPIALIDENMPVVFVVPQDHTYEKVLSNIEEVRGRHGLVVAVANRKDPELDRLCEDVLYVPETDPLLSPLVTTVPLQLLAYHAAVLRGHNVDKPRNLAKSVTVE
ncbi:MAG: glutamine--fructose-6-phosphate transaminase (isomerizing) [Candidatus Latescibacteria bacterium]|nr:glutamine--fructose-6-phosphate transaminase (isomerizing) [Candidatus Latescibacterota bacterium]